MLAASAVVGGVATFSGAEPGTQLETSSSQQIQPTIDKTTYLVKIDGSAKARTQTLNALSDSAASEDGSLGANLGGGWRSIKFEDEVEPKDAIEMLSVQGVSAVQPNELRELYGAGETAPRYKEQYYLNQLSNHDIDAPEAWRAGATGSTTVKVAVIDSGVEASHPDLLNTTVSPLGTTGTSATAPVISHGTSVAGLIAATGAKGVTGVAPGVKIIPIRADTPEGMVSIEGTILGINHAIAQGAKIINMSYGSDRWNPAEYDALLRANNAGILLVAAAGNDGVNNDVEPHYPASYQLPMILSVGASTKTGSIADFSNWGAEDVHVAAPGVETLSPVLGGKWALPSGTSFSAPIAAGVAALVKSKYPLASMYSIRQHMLITAKPDAGWKGKSLTGDVLSVGNAIKTAPPAIEQPPMYTAPVNPVNPVTPVTPEEPNTTIGGGPTTPKTSGVAVLESPKGNAVMGRWDSFSWDYSYPWEVANVQIDRGPSPDRDLLAPTKYGKLIGREGDNFMSLWENRQLPTGTYWWRVVTVPEDNPNGQLVASPHANFRVPSALRVAVGYGSLKLPSSRSKVVRSKIRVSPEFETNDTGAKVQVFLLQGSKIVWRSKVKSMSVKPGEITTTTFTGSPRISRTGKKRVMVKVTGSSGSVAKSTATMR